MDNTVTFIAFDFDLAKFAVHKAITNQRAWEAMMAKVHQAACRLLDAAAAQDLPMYLEDSGFKGRHAWIFLETPVPAGVAKKCGDLLAARLQPLPPEVTVEVFPKQGSIKPGGLGNLIKLPLGFHKRTGQRAWFIEPNGAPYPDQLQFLLSVSRASRRQVYAFIQRSQVQLQGAAAAGAQPATAAPASEAPAPWEPETAPEAAPPLPPAAAPYNLDTDPQFQHLVFKCPVLRAINEKIHQTSLLSKDETMVLIHTLGHLERGPQAVNELFQRCLNADPSLFLKSRLRGNPMSCPKIRARLPELTSTLACNCTFDLTVNLYPTPVIHLHGLSAAAPATPLGLTVESLQFQNLLKEYLKLRQQLRETQLLLGRYEERLSGFFSEAGVEEVQTAAGKLRRQLDQDGKAAFILEL
jgi:hypothetical protein